MNIKTLVGLFLAALAITAAAADLAVTEINVGGITAATNFQKRALEIALPSLIVKTDKREIEGESVPVFMLLAGNETLAIVTPSDDRKTILNIRITSSKVTNTLGPKIGSSYASIFGNAPNLECIPGEQELSGKVICPHPKSTHIFYLLTGKSDGFDGTLPSLKALTKHSVEEIIWRP